MEQAAKLLHSGDCEPAYRLLCLVLRSPGHMAVYAGVLTARCKMETRYGSSRRDRDRSGTFSHFSVHRCPGINWAQELRHVAAIASAFELARRVYS